MSDILYNMSDTDIQLNNLLNGFAQLVMEKVKNSVNEKHTEISKSSNETPKCKEKLTKDEIKQKLKEKGIKFRVRDSHETLMKLLNEEN